MHGTAVPWEPQEMSGQIVQPFSEVLLCRFEIILVLLHRCQHPQVALYPAVVVVGYVVLNHGNKFFSTRESSSVVPFPFQDAPESLHRTVINALGNSGHTLLHFCCLQLVIEYPVCILETSVTMEQRVCIWIGCYGSIQSIKYERIIVSVTDDIGHDSAVIQI